MSSKVKYLFDKKLIGKNSIPKDVLEGIQYETITGSVAYGVSSDTSDMDIIGFCIPAKNVIFPHLKGEIQGFGRQKKKFEQFQKHHIKDGTQGYDVTIYNIVKYFSLCMENNPNMIDSLYTPERCVLHSTKISEMVRTNRDIFLHKGAWFKFKGYSFSQMHKMDIKNPVGKRKEIVDKYGYDLKFAYHIVRLLLEVEQILIDHTLDLTRNRELLKSIRRGDWKANEIKEWFYEKEKSLEKIYTESSLRHSPDEESIKQLLLDCLEEYYGTLENCVEIKINDSFLLDNIEELLSKRR